MQDHQYTLTDIEMMLPWEREVYVAFVIQHLKEREEALKRGNAHGHTGGY